MGKRWRGMGTLLRLVASIVVCIVLGFVVLVALGSVCQHMTAQDPVNLQMAHFNGNHIAVRDRGTFNTFDKAMRLRDEATVHRLITSRRLLIDLDGQKCLISKYDVDKAPDAPVWVTIGGYEGQWLTVRKFVDVR